MESELSRNEERFQIVRSTIFCVSVLVGDVSLMAVGVFLVLNGEILLIAGVALVVVGVILAYFIGARPLWSQFAPPRN